MLIKKFNQAWEAERVQIEATLVERIDVQIKEIEFSIKASGGRMSRESVERLNGMKSELVLRKGLAVFESENIAKNRMQLRASYISLILSSLALIVSVTTVLVKL